MPYLIERFSDVGGKYGTCILILESLFYYFYNSMYLFYDWVSLSKAKLVV